jgi:hypothetical protein
LSQANTWDLCLSIRIFPNIMTSIKRAYYTKVIRKMIRIKQQPKFRRNKDQNSFISLRLSQKESICINNRVHKKIKSPLKSYTNSLIRWKSRKVPQVILREVSKTYWHLHIQSKIDFTKKRKELHIKISIQERT